MVEGYAIDWMAVGAVLGPLVALAVGIWTQRRATKADQEQQDHNETEAAIRAVKGLNETQEREIDRLQKKVEELERRLEDKQGN